jgi:hypothetical protein
MKDPDTNAPGTTIYWAKPHVAESDGREPVISSVTGRQISLD